ncbi:hypothetical protein EJB05_12244, partial [Eragrostis curvula]
MDHLQQLTAPSLSPSPSHGGGATKVVDAYKKALATAASAAAYAVLARSMARELLPDELRAGVRWAAAFVRARFLGRGERERHTLVIRSQQQFDPVLNGDNYLFEAARAYVATRINPRAVTRLCLTRSCVREPDGNLSGWRTRLCMEPGGTTTDVFEGVEFTWTSVETDGEWKTKGRASAAAAGPREALELSFDAEHTDVALERYVPFVLSTSAAMLQQDRALRIFMNQGCTWHGIYHHHPATFDTLAMDPKLKQSVIDDLDRFLKRRDHYRRIGKAWKRGYLLYGPPGTGKSSLVAAMANYLRFNLYDLDLSEAYNNTGLQKMLIAMPHRSILVVEDIDCCFRGAEPREDGKAKGPTDDGFDSDFDTSDSDDGLKIGSGRTKGITLSGLLNFIDGLWSTRGEERIIIFTTNYKERLDPALLRPGRMDMHIYMGYCCWEAFKTLARNYFLLDDHPLFPEIQQLLATVEVTPAEVSEMLLRSEDADIALQGLVEFLHEKKQRTTKKRERISKKTEDNKDVADETVSCDYHRPLSASVVN